MITKITGEQPFQVLINNFSISPSQEGYTLQISADGVNYSNLFTVGAGVTRLVTGVAANSFYRLSGNQSQVSINWMKTCVTEGGSGSSGNELAPVSEFPLGAEAGTVVAYSGSSSAAGVYQYDGSDWALVGGDDMSGYYTSGETDERIASAVTPVAEHLEEVEQITASALTELHDDILELSGSSVDLAAYYTSAQTEDAISAATSGKADAASVTASGNVRKFPTWNEQGIITGVADNSIVFPGYLGINSTGFSVYSRSSNLGDIYAPKTRGNAGDILVSVGSGAPVWSAITFPTPDVDKAYVDSADTALQDQIDTMDEVVSAALVDLNGKLANKVSSSSVSTIWKGTQAQYDAIVTKDPYTFYIIVSN